MEEIERNLGTQPLDGLMEQFGLENHDLVEASTEQITHKMVTRGRKGRRLTPNVQKKLTNALNAAVKGREGVTELAVADLFNY